jgi:1-pyrroline-4-hydroxy-2-carboxylate deaminase
MNSPWTGVFPALTTKFSEDLSLDIPAMERHIKWMLDSGVHGLIVLGSLGENATLTPAEKLEVLALALRLGKGRVPVLSCVAETSTRGACEFVEKTGSMGADGFMVLPGMQYASDPRETLHHLRSVAKVSKKPIMIYNNPVAYRVDITPEMLAEVTDEPLFVAVKESSDDVRRVTDIRNLTGDRYRLFCGVDDLAFESLIAGAEGWVAGLVCAFPRETVALYELVRAGRIDEARSLQQWFMPLLHLDVSTKFVHNIKLVEQLVGVGSEWLRPPRLPLVGEERKRVERIVEQALKTRPKLSAPSSRRVS